MTWVAARAAIDVGIERRQNIRSIVSWDGPVLVVQHLLEMTEWSTNQTDARLVMTPCRRNKQISKYHTPMSHQNIRHLGNKIIENDS